MRTRHGCNYTTVVDHINRELQRCDGGGRERGGRDHRRWPGSWAEKSGGSGVLRPFAREAGEAL